jgi:hypothetical protein
LASRIGWPATSIPFVAGLTGFWLTVAGTWRIALVESGEESKTG